MKLRIESKELIKKPNDTYIEAGNLIVPYQIAYTAILGGGKLKSE
jgi:hypothetical protein